MQLVQCDNWMQHYKKWYIYNARSLIKGSHSKLWTNLDKKAKSHCNLRKYARKTWKRVINLMYLDLIRPIKKGCKKKKNLSWGVLKIINLFKIVEHERLKELLNEVEPQLMWFSIIFFQCIYKEMHSWHEYEQAWCWIYITNI